MAQSHEALARAVACDFQGLAEWVRREVARAPVLSPTLLRRAIPVLVVAFVAALGVDMVARTLQTAATYYRAERDKLRLAEVWLRSTTAKVEEPEERLRTLQQAVRLLSDERGEVELVRLDSSAAAAAGLLGRDAHGTDRALTSLAGALLNPAAQLVVTQPLEFPGQSYVLQRDISDVLPAWRRLALAHAALYGCTGFVVILLGFSFSWQAQRARDADQLAAAVRLRLETALDNGRCGIWDWDVARGRMYWSASMFALLGLQPREGVVDFGEIASRLHADDGDFFQLADDILAGKRQSVDRLLRVRHAGGDWIWLRVSATTQNGTARTPHMMGIAVDVTEQRRQIEKSNIADARLRDAINTISESFVLWDAQNELVVCNSKFQLLHGLESDVVQTGTPYHTLAASARHPIVKSSGANPVCNGDDGASTYEAQVGDGRWLNISERRTKDGGFVSVGTDITVLKQHEQQLLATERRLRATIADLSATSTKLEAQASEMTDLAEKYAIEKARAESALRIKSEFLANISHELRTPLNAIIGFSEIMQAGLFGSLGAPKYQEYCQDIHSSGQYLLDVINDILDMSKIEAGRLQLNLELFSVETLVNEAMRLIAARASAKAIVLSRALLPPDLKVEADKRAIKQVLLNLLSNAVKFTPEGGRIHISVEKNDEQVVFAIQDSGIGISAALIAQLGQPFVQIVNSYTKNHNGSGLGLAISRSLAELHGGTLNLSSQEGRGTRATLILPHMRLLSVDAPAPVVAQA